MLFPISNCLSLSKKITNYNAEDIVNPELERTEAEIDEEGGVAMVFDEEDRDNEDDEGFKIREGSDEEEEEEQGDGDIVIDISEIYPDPVTAAAALPTT